MCRSCFMGCCRSCCLCCCCCWWRGGSEVGAAGWAGLLLAACAVVVGCCIRWFCCAFCCCCCRCCCCTMLLECKWQLHAAPLLTDGTCGQSGQTAIYHPAQQLHLRVEGTVTCPYQQWGADDVRSRLVLRQRRRPPRSVKPQADGRIVLRELIAWQTDGCKRARSWRENEPRCGGGCEAPRRACACSTACITLL